MNSTDPQALIEKILRLRIYESVYWKEECFGLTAETLVDKAVALDRVGGLHGVSPTPFLCLVLKILQLQPEPEILETYLQNTEFKYLTALAAMAIRLTFPPMQVYLLLEPYLADFRALRTATGPRTFMDVFVDQLLTDPRVCDILLPRLVPRRLLDLSPRPSALRDNDGDDEHGATDSS